ncbi:MAG: KilA-N domain-containing protein [Mucilaginibacter sp.]
MNALTLNISNTTIRQDLEGRYCLNNLHQASGGEQKHRPKYFLDIQQTKDLIVEIDNYDAGIPASKILEGEITPSKINAISIIQGKGKQQGTYAVKELVYAYAMWISPAFTLKVIHAYDSLVSVQYGLKELPEPPTITKAQQGILFNKVTDIAAGRGQVRTQLWSRFQNHFKLNSYKNLPAEQFDDALAYLKAKQYEYSNGVEMLYVSNVELDALVSERIKSVQGELMDKEPAVDTQRYLVTIKPNGQHIVPVDLNCFYMTEERFISYLRGNGFLVFKKDQLNIGDMVLNHIPYRYLGYMVEVAGKRLSNIQSDKLNP